jgi:hypothetical protein
MVLEEARDGLQTKHEEGGRANQVWAKSRASMWRIEDERFIRNTGRLQFRRSFQVGRALVSFAAFAACCYIGRQIKKSRS